MRYPVALSWFLGLCLLASGCGEHRGPGENSNNNDVTICGDGLVSPGEVCDGTHLRGLRCPTVSPFYVSGTLACQADCAGFDTSGCETRADLCGNGRLDPVETCDGSLLGGQDCVSLGWGYLGGQLGCNTTCDGWDLSGCDPICRLRWADLRPDGETIGPEGVALDEAGNLFVLAVFHSEVSFGGDIHLPVDDQDMLLGKLDADGIPLWSLSFNSGIGDIETIHEVRADDHGDILLLGPFSGSVSFGGDDLIADHGSMYCVKLSGEGQHLWSRRLIGVAGFASLTLDTTGNALVAGSFVEVLALDDATLLGPEDDASLFLATFDSGTGAHLWSKSFNHPEGWIDDVKVALDPVGQIVMAGSFGGTVSLGGASLSVVDCPDGPSPPCRIDLFLAKLAVDGSHNWSRSIDYTGGYIKVDSLRLDPEANIIISGGFNGEIDFGLGAVLSAESYGMFVAKLDPEGQHLWSYVFDARFDGMAVDAAGHIALAAEFSGPTSFGGATFGESNTDGLMIAVFDSTGQHVWSSAFLAEGVSNYTDSSDDLVMGRNGELAWGGSLHHYLEPGTDNPPNGGFENVDLLYFDCSLDMVP